MSNEQEAANAEGSEPVTEGLAEPDVPIPLLESMVEMGFPRNRAIRALHFSEAEDIETAITWLADNEDAEDIDEPLLVPPKKKLAPEEQKKQIEEIRRKAKERREKEEKEAERVRERERIRSGKELLAALEKEKEQEKQRNIELRKREKEQDKIAKEKIRKKIEEDRRERRRKLGLPEELTEEEKAREEAKREAKAKEETDRIAKHTAYAKPVGKMETLRNILVSMKQNNPEDRFKTACNVLMKYIGNLASSPGEEKFRRIRIGNDAFQKKVATVVGGTEFLMECGFERQEEYLVIPEKDVRVDTLNAAGTVINGALREPEVPKLEDLRRQKQKGRMYGTVTRPSVLYTPRYSSPSQTKRSQPTSRTPQPPQRSIRGSTRLFAKSEETTSDSQEDTNSDPTSPQKPRRLSSVNQISSLNPDETEFNWQDFLRGELPKKLAILLGLIALSRLGVYIRLPGIDVDAFAAKMQTGGLLGYVDTLSGGSISRVGCFSLGIIPYINASILLQILSVVFPFLKKLQRDEGPTGREKFKQYTQFVAIGFAVIQAIGQLSYLRPYVQDWSIFWFIGNTAILTGGAAVLIFIAEYISELKLGNGTSLLIFANIASSLPTSFGATLQQAAEKDQSNLAVFGLAFFLTTLGIVYVQEAERRIPMNYASRYQAGALGNQAYLPFKVNATGVMPVIFASSLMAIPSGLARNSSNEFLIGMAKALYPTGALYVPVSVGLIAVFNSYYTFIQLDPKDVGEQLKKQGASIPGIRPGRATADFIKKTLTRMSVLGSGFLGALAAAPAAVEGITHLTAFRGFAGTSVLILVGVASDTARRVRAEQAMGKYRNLDDMYKDIRL